MKNRYLRLISALSAVFMISLLSNAQTIYSNYVDGKIWVKVSADSPMNMYATIDGQIEKDHRNLTVAQVPFLEEVAKTVNFTRIEQPYHHITDQGLNRIYRLTFDNPMQVDYLIETLQNMTAIEYAEKVELMKKTLTPNDPNFNVSTMWGLYQISAENAWNLGTGSSSVVVAIVDDAVEITHSDLSGVIWTNAAEASGTPGVDDDGNGYIDDINGYDVANNDNDPNPDGPSYDHGTHVAGTAGAETDNSTGVASIGFGVSIMAVKATNSPTVISDGYDGIVYAVASGADVINMSWGGSGSSGTAQSIIDYAYSNGVVCVAAAGNDNVSTMFYPAAYNNVISVASSTTGDSKSSFSNYGSWIDITAPGSAIYSTVPGNAYAYKQGTSMASPQVAGLAGLLLSLNPGLNPDDIENCIRSTADNIDAANPSYIGDLGDGRINAFAAMNCVAATLAWPPVADFTADLQFIVEGQSVNFTDLSYYNPDTWTWTFTGGTPASFIGQNPPPIQYLTAGTYPVALTVSNPNGSDTKTEVGYITVNGLSGCDTISNTIPTDPNFTWRWGAGGVDGLIAGQNVYESAMVAEQYTGYGPTNLMGATFHFTVGETFDPTAYVEITVWGDGGGEPGAELYTEQVLLEDIEYNIVSAGVGFFYPTLVRFDQPVAVPTNFYVGYKYYYTNPTDSVACAMTDNLTASPGRPNTMFYWFNNGDPLGIGPAWIDLETLSGSQWSMHIYPWITDAPPVASFTSTSPVCEGDYMAFDGSGSSNAVNWDWAINGTSTPYPTGVNPSVIMNTAGTHWVYLAAYNYCGFWHVDSAQVTVDPTPNVAVTASTTVICPTGSANLTASGATSYVWSPTTGLSCSTCPNPVATPASTTTYTVTGTTGGCSNDSYITIDVDNSPPVSMFLQDNDTICEGDAVTYNGAVSTNASTYSWAFTGGDISSSTSSNVTVTYASAGTYTIDLTVENNCTQTDLSSGQIVVLPLTAPGCATGLEDLGSLTGITSFMDAHSDEINIDFLNAVDGQVTIELISATGQLVSSQTIENIANGYRHRMNVESFERAIYMLRVSSVDAQYVSKFVID